MYVRMPPRFGVSATAAAAPNATTAPNTNFKNERKTFHIGSERGDKAGRLIVREPSCLLIACSSANVLQRVSCPMFDLPSEAWPRWADLEGMISDLDPRRVQMTSGHEGDTERVGGLSSLGFAIGASHLASSEKGHALTCRCPCE